MTREERIIHDRIFRPRKEERIIRERAKRRLGLAVDCWSWLEGELEGIGAKPVLFGSMAKGGFHCNSDIDVMVSLEGMEADGRSRIERVLRFAKDTWKLPIDAIYREDLDPANVEALLR